MKQGLHWLLTDMDQNRDLFPEGYGITEISRSQRGADRRGGVHPAGAARPRRGVAARPG